MLKFKRNSWFLSVYWTKISQLQLMTLARFLSLEPQKRRFKRYAIQLSTKLAFLDNISDINYLKRRKKYLCLSLNKPEFALILNLGQM